MANLKELGELGLFSQICPEMIRCATAIVEEMFKNWGNN